MQSKSTKRYHLTSISFLKKKIISSGKDVEKMETCWWDCKMGHIWNIENSTEFSQKKKNLRIELSYDTLILCLVMYLKELKAGSQRDICI